MGKVISLVRSIAGAVRSFPVLCQCAFYRFIAGVAAVLMRRNAGLAKTASGFPAARYFRDGLFVGQLAGGLPEGRGFYADQHCWYFGDFKNGKFDGRGVLMCTRPDHWSRMRGRAYGYFLGGFLRVGTFTKIDGSFTFRGEFRNAQPFCGRLIISDKPNVTTFGRFAKGSLVSGSITTKWSTSHGEEKCIRVPYEGGKPTGRRRISYKKQQRVVLHLEGPVNQGRLHGIVRVTRHAQNGVCNTSTVEYVNGICMTPAQLHLRRRCKDIGASFHMKRF